MPLDRPFKSQSTIQSLGLMDPINGPYIDGLRKQTKCAKMKPTALYLVALDFVGFRI